ncbi:(2Fe-2S)-binding protein [Streptomyces sp. NPDC020096]
MSHARSVFADHTWTAARPLADLYRQLARHCEAWCADFTAGPAGWIPVADLTSRPEALAAVIDGESARILAEHGLRPRRDVAASRVLHHYLWTACLLFSGPWYLDRRVPRIPSDQVRIDPASGTLAIAPDRCTVVGRAARPAELRDAVADHVGPVLRAFAPEVRRGPRALWGMAADDLVSGIWYLGRTFDDERRGVREATAVLPGATPPFPGAAAFRELSGPAGRRQPTRTRQGCCMYYAIRPDEACLTCPRTSDAERVRRMA